MMNRKSFGIDAALVVLLLAWKSVHFGSISALISHQTRTVLFGQTKMFVSINGGHHIRVHESYLQIVNSRGASCPHRR